MLFRAENKRGMIPGWFWALLFGLPLGFLIWWFLRWFFLPSYKRTSAVEIQTPRSAVVPLSVNEDDFTIIKGIGPKTAAGLTAAGVYTFEQLGLMDPDRLEMLLKAQSLPTASAAYWQQQAVLAAAQDWEALD